MPEHSTRRHGLEAGLQRLQARIPDDAGRAARLRVTVMASLGHLNLRGDPADARFVEGVEGVLQQPLPVVPNTVSDGDHRIFWLGPDEWLVSTPRAGLAALVADLDSALEGLHAAVNDLGGGQVLLRLQGAACREALAAGCTLDLHPRAFAPGRCAQTGLARAAVLLAPLGDPDASGSEDGMDLVVRLSFADYLLDWLAAMAGERGLAAAVA
jgi:sarcosine oxidase subunit gamma